MKTKRSIKQISCAECNSIINISLADIEATGWTEGDQYPHWVYNDQNGWNELCYGDTNIFLNETSRNDYEALVLALNLAITAKTDEQANVCVGMAEEIAARMSVAQVEKAKIEAEIK